MLAGCGHAQLPLLRNINALVAAGHTTTVINPGTHLHYSGMSPGYVGGTYRDDELRIHVAALARKGGAQYIDGAVERIDIARRVMSVAGASVPYDIASLNVGSQTVLSTFEYLEEEALYESIFPAKPTKNFLGIKDRLQQCFAQAHEQKRPCVISVIGGGPAAVEIAANIQMLYDAFRAAGSRPMRSAGSRPMRSADASHPVCAASLITVRIFHGGGVLFDHRRRLRALSARALVRYGVEMHSPRVVRLHRNTIVTADGERQERSYPSDLTVVATGVEAPAFLRASGFTTDSSGALHVNRYLQSVDSPAVFASGDCAHFTPHPLPKVGVYAVRQGETIKHNVIASAASLRTPASSRVSASSRALVPFRPQRHFFFSLNIGFGYGIAAKYRLAWRGRGAFRLKDRFDRKFIEHYQDR